MSRLLPKQDRFKVFPLLISGCRVVYSNPRREVPGGRVSVKIRILIVDDDEALRDALEGVLKTAGLHAGKFSSAEELLDSPALQTASCLILDVRLPGMSGIELQHLIREMSDPVPIIFLTAHGDAEIRDLVVNAGALGYLTKPVHRSLLLQMVCGAIALRGA